MWVKASASRIEPPAGAGECLHVSQRGDDLFRVRLERLGALEWPSWRTDRDARPARQKMKMQMEDLLAARRFVELLEQEPLGVHAGHDRAPNLLHGGHELRQIFGIEIKERARRPLWDDQRMAFDARHHVHE